MRSVAVAVSVEMRVVEGAALRMSSIVVVVVSVGICSVQPGLCSVFLYLSAPGGRLDGNRRTQLSFTRNNQHEPLLQGKIYPPSVLSLSDDRAGVEL